MHNKRILFPCSILRSDPDAKILVDWLVAKLQDDQNGTAHLVQECRDELRRTTPQEREAVAERIAALYADDTHQ
jgi:hypothetical protein